MQEGGCVQQDGDGRLEAASERLRLMCVQCACVFGGDLGRGRKYCAAGFQCQLSRMMARVAVIQL